jgi:hypothetical protein
MMFSENRHPLFGIMLYCVMRMPGALGTRGLQLHGRALRQVAAPRLHA